MSAPEKVCVIGAGSSGITACQVLASRGIPFDCFEKGSRIGGNWRYENDNGLSSAYRSLHINSGRRIMSFRAYPMPDDLPDYPDHFQIARYFDDYVEHFGLARQDHVQHRGRRASSRPRAAGMSRSRAPTAARRPAATAP